METFWLYELQNGETQNLTFVDIRTLSCYDGFAREGRGGIIKCRLRTMGKEIGLTQENFAKRLSMEKSIANYKIGRNGSIDAIIPFICQESKVNGAWLRTGNIDMMKAYF